MKQINELHRMRTCRMKCDDLIRLAEYLFDNMHVFSTYDDCVASVGIDIRRCQRLKSNLYRRYGYVFHGNKQYFKIVDIVDPQSINKTVYKPKKQTKKQTKKQCRRVYPTLTRLDKILNEIWR